MMLLSTARLLSSGRAATCSACGECLVPKGR